MIIPKKIHYCWFGRGDMPESAIKCIDTWKKYLPDYELVLWNEDSYDINSNKYVREAYDAKKYAFVTDYVRLYALYNYGGIYMDTDVEVVKPLDKFLFHRAFTGCEREDMCVTGTMGAEKYHPWIKDLIDYYRDRSFLLPDGSYDETPNTKSITRITMESYGWQAKDEYQELKEDLHIYPYEVFCAKNIRTGKIEATNNTYTIHHFSGSWQSESVKFKKKILRLVGPKLRGYLTKTKDKRED